MLALIWKGWRHGGLLGLLPVAVATALSCGLGVYPLALQMASGSAALALETNRLVGYDILVRPPGIRTEIEDRYGLVEANHLSGVPGGISIEEYEAIRETPGVEVAAPIAMLGYYRQSVPIAAGQYPGPGAYRLKCTLEEYDGTRQYTEESVAYYYVGEDAEALESPEGQASVILLAAQPECSFTYWALLAAIDPAAEANLVGLDGAIEGDYLDDAEVHCGGAAGPSGEPWCTIPAIVSLTPVVQFTLSSELALLALPEDVENLDQLLEQGGAEYLEGLSTSQIVHSSVFGAQEAHREFLSLALGARPQAAPTLQGSPWLRPSPVTYQEASPPEEGLQGPVLGVVVPEAEEASLPGTASPSYRRASFIQLPQLFDCEFIGTFNIQALPSYPEAPISTREVYNQPLAVTRYDPDGKPARTKEIQAPLNPLGWLQQPPTILTTMEAATTLFGEAPISAIRVRVAGGDLERIEAVASELRTRTGLDVQVVAGSSPRTTLVQVASEDHKDASVGYVEEQFIERGVALPLYPALDKASRAAGHIAPMWIGLLTLVALVALCATRVHEYALLMALSWRRRSVSHLALAEGLMTGVVAGLIGILVTLIEAFHLAGPPPRGLWLVVALPVACSLLGSLLASLRARRHRPTSVLKAGGTAALHAPKGLGRAGRVAWHRAAETAAVFLACGAAAAGLSALGAIRSTTQPVVRVSELGQFILSQAASFSGILVDARTFVAVAAVTGILLWIVEGRGAEIGLLRAQGWRPARILWRILPQIVLPSLLGGVVGSLLGAQFTQNVFGTAAQPWLVVVAAGLWGPVLADLLAVLYSVVLVFYISPARLLRQHQGGA